MKKVLAVFLGVLMLVGCEAKSEAQQSFKGNEYKMINTPNNVEVTIGFDAADSKFYGKVANRFFGVYVIDGNKVTLGPTGTTMMMGSPEMMEVEMRVLQSLPMIRTFKFEGDKLIFTTEDGIDMEFEKTGEFKK